MEIIQNETNIGLIRKNNEDVALSIRHPKDKNIILLLVADGMGGKSYGELASAYVSKSIEKWFKNKSPNKLSDLENTESSLEKLIDKIKLGKESPLTEIQKTLENFFEYVKLPNNTKLETIEELPAITERLCTK